ncbi:Uncharacterized protein MSYG_3885 [Malassezia sympodialis ATCC 42132]|uniref:Uncharacterized protein n=1 Tax=Malassezia sympodialis (strain ATCC 42132) TaxID=1230383 RepID=A0A1M8AAN0_MALS4|nr:Uncharacterized protein MSYG_3885 [Malassezia sympodialis ATCC 42132]
MDDDRRTNLIKLAAEGLLDSHPIDTAAIQSSVAANTEGPSLALLTADNLEQIPLAEQLAPGIRMPEQVVESGANDMHDSSTDMLPLPSETGADTSVPTCVPPELDPRASVFRPGIPSTGSVFSVAVQPGSPKSILLDQTERHSELRTSSPAPSRSFRADSPCSEDRSSFSNTAPQYSTVTQSSNAATHPGSSGADSASVVYSDAGSVMSDRSQGTSNSDIRNQEQFIEAQRMQERALLGGEVGIGGPISVPFARLRDRLSDIDKPHRSVSTSATAATSPIQTPEDKMSGTPMAHSPYFATVETPGSAPDSEAVSRSLEATLT